MNLDSLQTPVYTAAEQRANETFTALMHAMSFPGRAHALPAGPGLLLVGEALLDLETTFHTPDAALAARLAETGARTAGPETAAYHFYPAFDAADIARASAGTPEYPDTAATLVVGAHFPADGAGMAMQWRGPGIAGAAAVRIAGLPDAWWHERARPPRFPLGVDVFFVAENADAAHSLVIALPRSTAVALA